MSSGTGIIGRITRYLLAVLLLIVIGVFLSIPVSRIQIPDDLPAVDNTQAIAVDNVNLVTMKGNEVKKNQQVLIRNGVIESIRARGTATASEYKVINASGAWMLPGLFDMHAHVYDRKYQVLSLTYGVTSVRSMNGIPAHLRWKKELEDGRWLGSDLLAASPILNGEDYSNPLADVTVEDPEHARSLVRDYANAGWDYIKIYAGLGVDTFTAVMDEAGKQGIPVVGHAPYAVVEKDYTMLRDMRTLEHVEDIYQGPLGFEFNEAKLATTAELLKDMDATVTPTLMIFDHLTRISRDKHAYINTLPLSYLNPLLKFLMDQTDGKRWVKATAEERDHNIRVNDFLHQVVRVLHRHGVRLVLGSDYGVIYAVPGLATHDEMAHMYQAGLSPWEVLRTATVNASETAGLGDRLGTLEVGKTADMILVPANPLFDIGVLREPRAVIKNGQYLDRERILELRVSSLYPSNVYISMGRILEFLVSK